QRSSGRTTTHTLSSLPAPCATASNGTDQPSARAPTAAPMETMKSRRDSSVAAAIEGIDWFMVAPPSCLGHLERRGTVHRGTDALVGAAAADVGHRGIDVGIARLVILGQQRGRGHDLARLAVAALRHV